MILTHHDLKIELDDAWWAEAGMTGFVPSGRSFCPNVQAAEGKVIFEARIDEVGSIRRNPGVGIFNDNEEATARERVVRILKGFLEGAAIPPVMLVKCTSNSDFRWKIGNGSHRFYCSLAAGFSHVPAIEGLDFSAPYI
ncbi:MAG: hypothetical protein ABSA13_01810 [Beijerinckiaceae bacterium]|jgi:hypothetical protein